MLEENEILITDENGASKTMKILFTYENEARKHKYVFVYDEDNEDDVNVYIYDENNYTLEEIEDDEEYSEAEEVFNTFMDFFSGMELYVLGKKCRREFISKIPAFFRLSAFLGPMPFIFSMGSVRLSILSNYSEFFVQIKNKFGSKG